MTFASCGAIVSLVFESGDGRRFKLAPVHKPTEKDLPGKLPENYAHSLVCTIQPPEDHHVKPSAAARKHARLLLAGVFVSVRE